MSDGYVLRQYGNEVQEILDDVQQKTVYDRATSSKDGLMSSTDKQKLDSYQALSNMEIENILNNIGL